MTTDAVMPVTTLRRQEAIEALSSGTAHLYFTPADVDLSIEARKLQFASDCPVLTGRRLNPMTADSPCRKIVIQFTNKPESAFLGEVISMVVRQFVLPFASSGHDTDYANVSYLERLKTLLSGDLDFHGQDSGYASHNFHAFPAKFPPQLPRSSDRCKSLGADPMMSSGS